MDSPVNIDLDVAVNVNPDVSIASDATQSVPADIARCLSPGPISEGSVDRESLPWPFSECPDWPINDTWRDFAFAPVTFRPLTVDIEQFPDPDIVL